MMKCPTCGCQKFYIKDPEDKYETHPIELKEGGMVAFCDQTATDGLQIQPDTETYCDRCLWHGKLRQLIDE